MDKKFFCVVLGLSLLVAVSGFAQASLSPETASYRPPITGTDYMVESNHPLATMAGSQILENGGNAIDAATAVAAALSVVEPSCSNIFGGDAFIIIYSAEDDKVIVIDGSGWAPAAATLDYYKEKGGIDARGIDTVEIPGAFSGWMMAMDLYGSKSLKKVFAPAIDLCENGVTMTPFFRWMLGYAYPDLNDEAKAIFAPEGKVPEVGDIIYQRDLAATFRDVCKGSPSRAERKFYNEYGARISEFSDSLGGLLAPEDFSEFRAEVVEPLTTNFHGVDVYAAPPGCQGMALIEALNILEPYDFQSMGHNSAEYINVIVEAFNLAFADRDKYCSDPRFVDIPIEGLMSKEYAAALREKITLGAVNAEPVDIDPDEYYDVSQENTTFFAVVDEDRNVVACTTSILNFFGSGLVAGDTGILLNDRMAYFWLDEDHPNVVAPRKRTFQTITPSIALKDGKPFIAFGTPGSDVQEQTKLQILFNQIFFGMNPQQAVEAPRFRTYAFPGSMYPHRSSPGLLRFEPRIPDTEMVAGDLMEMGYDVQLYPEWTISVGGAGMVVIDPETGALMGGVDPRREGYVVGW